VQTERVSPPWYTLVTPVQSAVMWLLDSSSLYESGKHVGEPAERDAVCA
jgi:hypothetical protein